MKNLPPSYLGLGILNPATIRAENNEVIAEYTLFGKMVTKLTISDRASLIEDYHEGKRLNITSNRDLNNGICMHFNYWDAETDPRFKILMDAVCHLGNIYFEIPPCIRKKNQRVQSYSPAGRLLIFRFPMPGGHFKIFEAVQPNDAFEIKPFFNFLDLYFATLNIFNNNGSCNNQPIFLFEVLVPLAYAYDAAKWFCDRNLILPRKIYRMIIQDSVHKDNESFMTFLGTASDSWSEYMLHFRGLLQNDELFKKTEKIFKNKISSI